MKKLSSRAGPAAAHWNGTEPAAATHQDHHAPEAEKASSSADEHVSPLLSMVVEDKNSVWQENSQIKDRYVHTCSSPSSSSSSSSGGDLFGTSAG